MSQAGFGSGLGVRPGTAFSEAANSLGAGPGLSVMDRGASVPFGLFGHPALIALCREVAARKKIPYQIEGSMPIITSDAAAVQFAGAGVPSLTQPDGIHPNADGAKAVAEAIYPRLRTIVDSIGRP